jgi:fumarate reductase flavoprotein subunit
MSDRINQSVSRRDFIAGAACAGAAGFLAAEAAKASEPAAASTEGDDGAATAAGSAAGDVTSIGAAASVGMSETDGKHSWEVVPDPIPEDKISQTIESDFVVVGAGIAGLPAAARAAELGSVQVLEKGSSYGPIREGGWAYNCRLQQEAGIELTQEDRDGVLQRFLKGSQNVQVNGENLNHFINNTAPFYDWATDVLQADGVDVHVDELYGPFGVSLGKSGYPQSDDYQASFLEYAQSQGAVVNFETAAERLEQDESGRVTGVIAHNTSGEYIRFTASKGVLLATGSINRNPEMMEYFFPRSEYISTLDMALSTVSGDGNLMAMWVGADHDRLLWGDMLALSATPGFELMPVAVGALPVLWVNIAGRRAINEAGDQYFPESVHFSYEMNSTQGILAQPEGHMWSIFDSAWEDKYADVTDSGNMFGLFGKDSDPDYEGLPSPLGVCSRDMFEQELAAGAIIQADTIEDLAVQMGVDPDTLAQTVERYNELCANGYDADFFKDPKWLKPIDQPPYYAGIMGASVFCSRGGVRVDYRSRVLDKKGMPIEGLYAAGVMVGGNTAYYSQMTTPATSQVGGYIAVQDAFGEEVL